MERVRQRREEEERLERERKMAAQKKLQELEEKTKNKPEILKEKETTEEKKYSGEKYNDTYDYGRGAPNSEFKKSSFQSNLPPRFQKQHHEKPPGNYGKPIHQETKNVPFSQQQSSYEQQRWSYNKQVQQTPTSRRHISSLSQSSSDDNRRDNNTKGYNRRRQESEEDDYRKKQAAQITRSMSDSSDKLSDHNRSEKSASREYLGSNVCWAEACDNDKRPAVDAKTRRVSESSAMSDDAPRTILQRKQPEKKEEIAEEKKTVLNDVQPVKEVVEVKEQTTIDSKKNLESIPEKTDTKDMSKIEAPKNEERVKKFEGSRESKESRDSRDSRYGPSLRGNYNSYRGGNSYSRRGGGTGTHRRYEYSDSENSDDEWNRNGHKKRNFNATGGQKEGFSPRGEPSRRGRGGITNSQASGFRRSGSNGTVVAPSKNYGPPSSKSPFGSNDEKSGGEKNLKEKSEDDDRTKQKQKALSDGLLNKSQKESSNVAVKAAEKEKTEETVKQHSTESDKKLEKKGQVVENTKKPAIKQQQSAPVVANKTIAAQSQQQTQQPNHYQQTTQQKSMNSMNRNEDRPRMDPRNTQSVNNGNSRIAPRYPTKQGPPQGNTNNGSNMNRMSNTSSSYWDKNHEETLQSMNSPSPSNNLLKTETMKGQGMQQPQLDGASLKTTLIFENTSYKRPPPPMGQPPAQQKPQENAINTINDMIDQQNKEQQQQQQSLSSALQNLSFGSQQQKPQANDMVDMNFSYTFDSQIGGLLTDKSSGFAAQNANQAVSKASSLGLVDRAKTGSILNTDALNMKVASCKKVWEETSVSNEHSADDVMSNFVQQQHLQHYGGHNNMQQSYGYGASNNDIEHFSKSNDADESASYPSPSQQQQHMQQVQQQKAAEAFSSANVCKVKPTQQQMHQTGLSPPPQMQQHQTYYSTPSYSNMPTIPSPPAVVYPQQAAYNPYGNMEAARAAQLAYGYTTGGANNSMSFNAFMQQPNLASAPTHEMYPNLSQYRTPVQPFNQNNPLLISSATAQQKPQNSQIGAIGSKSSSSSASGQYNQQYMNHVYHHQQNNYYNSTAQQANPYYSGPPTGSGGATTNNYGMFPSQNNGPPPPQPQQMANFGSVGQFPLGSQMLSNLVINQQYRNGPVVNTGTSGNGNTSGGNSNAPGAGGNYMKQQQQHQSQLQDPVSSTTFFKNV